MFIKPGGFKKLIKAAAATSNGLHVKNERNAIVLDATFFKLWVYRDKIPKEILGELVSVAGMLPDPGEAVLVNKYYVQEEMPETIERNAMEIYEAADTEYYATNMQINENGWLRVFQAEEHESLPAICVPEAWLELIRYDAIDLDGGEKRPEAPRVRTESKDWILGGGLTWANNHMALSFPVMRPDKMACEIRAMNRLRLMRAGESEEEVETARRSETCEE